jgi:hypothetical protein
MSGSGCLWFSWLLRRGPGSGAFHFYWAVIRDGGTSSTCAYTFSPISISASVLEARTDLQPPGCGRCMGCRTKRHTSATLGLLFIT